jgi:hypothetical protein
MPERAVSPPSGHFALKLSAVALVIAAIGLPINSPAAYAALVVATVIIFSGTVRSDLRVWLAAALIVVAAVAGQILLAPPRIDEGHNVFVPGGPGKVLERGLPSQVYQRLNDEFNAQYPEAVRCKAGSTGCWQNGGFPDRLYAFSADGIFHPSPLSRSVTGIDFSDPTWLGLGFVNENRYNWYTEAPDVRRADRNRQFWMGYRRWEFAMPWFETIVMPAAMTGGELCWRGDVMWEGANENFSHWPGQGCRTIEPADAGRRIFGLALKPGSLAMHFTPPLNVRLKQAATYGIALMALCAVIIVLIRTRPRQMLLPFAVVGLVAAAVAVDDASFLGGLRPLEGGDDGLFYDGVGRVILQKILAGDIFGALEGGEAVFYYGGPGLRYFRAIEHVVFGETFLGFLTMLMIMPFVIYFLFVRFLSRQWSLVLTFCFIVLPTGMLFGTSFANYAKWAGRGYADPMAYILFLAGMLPIIGFSASGPSRKFIPAFCGALLLALAIFMKPIIAPAAAVLLGGAGLYALYLRQWPRIAGLCIGFLPVFSMALHNWVYGHVFVLFSANDAHPLVLVMPPSAYIAAAREVLRFDFLGEHVLRWFANMLWWLTGPSAAPWRLYGPLVAVLVLIHAGAIAILVYVTFRGRKFDPWLRLIGAAALAQHSIVLFYTAAVARYHYLTWFLTMLVVMVFLYQTGFAWLGRRYPVLSERLLLHPLSRWFANGLSRLEKVSA